jgi:iron complex outermembrane receptor protein
MTTAFRQESRPGRQRVRAAVAALIATGAASWQGAVAQQAPPAAPDNIEEVVVTGRRVSEAAIAIGTDQATATVAITRDALLSAPAGITGLKVLESLPGFNVQANDALGMYEFGNSVSVRAFSFRQIGFVLDGIPLGRSDQFGGSPIYRYVDNENLQRVVASAGSGDVALPSYASLGPIVSYQTIDPSRDAGLAFSQTAGSDNLRRSFLRAQTGEHGGFSGYASASIINGDLWRGPGTIDRDHYEGKLRYDWGDSALTLQATHNDYFDYDSPSIRIDQYRGTANDPFGRSGRDFAYLGEVPVLPQTAPGVQYSNGNYNQYYKQAINSRTDTLYGLNLRSRIGEAWGLSATAYYEDKEGYGVSPEAYATSLASYNAERLIIPGLTAPRGLQYGLSTVDGIRKGITSSADFEAGIHRLTATAWIERDNYHRTQGRYNQEGGSPDGTPLLNEPVHRQRDYVSRRDTLQLSLKDVISLYGDRLKLELGAKALDIDYRISGYRNPADFIARRQPTLTDHWKDSFLPQVGAVFNLDARDQLFASYSENLALPQGADDIFSQASPAVPGPEAETAKNWELGVRANRATFNASLAAYYTTFDNRLQSFAAPVPGSTTTENFFQNVGGVESWGLELSGQWKPELLGGRAYFNTNASWNHARFEDSYSTLAIAGNDVPDFPRFVFQGGITWEALPSALVNVSARYIGERYSNFTNAERVGGYALFNAYVELGNGFSFGPLSEVKLRVNVDNIFDRDYLGTITTTTSTAATYRPGPPRTVQVTLSAQF